MFTIKHEKEHYAVYKDGVFYCTTDTKSEANSEIFEASKGCGNCKHEFRGIQCAGCSRNIKNYFAGGIDNWQWRWAEKS